MTTEANAAIIHVELGTVNLILRTNPHGKHETLDTNFPFIITSDTQSVICLQHWSMWLELPCYHWGVQQILQAVRRDHLIHHQRKEHVFLAGIVQTNADILWYGEEQTVQLHTHPKPHERQDRFWRLHKCTWNPCSFIPVRRITRFR